MLVFFKKFEHLTNPIQNMFQNEHGYLKPGLNLAIGFLLKKKYESDERILYPRKQTQRSRRGRYVFCPFLN